GLAAFPSRFVPRTTIALLDISASTIFARLEPVGLAVRTTINVHKATSVVPLDSAYQETGA
ncbi:MAG: hypothetical protein AAF658_05590, partial [Myxococcota bacterium]